MPFGFSKSLYDHTEKFGENPKFSSQGMVISQYGSGSMILANNRKVAIV